MRIQLIRDGHQVDPRCTLGRIQAGAHRIETLELPWRPHAFVPCGEPFVSCIPPGVYQMSRRFTERRGQHWLLANPELRIFATREEIPPGTTGRFLILIHAANWPHELRGCIAPGLSRVLGDEEPMLRQSARALALLGKSLGAGVHSLEVIQE